MLRMFSHALVFRGVLSFKKKKMNRHCIFTSEFQATAPEQRIASWANQHLLCYSHLEEGHIRQDDNTTHLWLPSPPTSYENMNPRLELHCNQPMNICSIIPWRATLISIIFILKVLNTKLCIDAAVQGYFIEDGCRCKSWVKPPHCTAVHHWGSDTQLMSSQ